MLWWLHLNPSKMDLDRKSYDQSHVYKIFMELS